MAWLESPFLISTSSTCTQPLRALYVVPMCVRRQVLYPILMFVMVCRTIIIRVLPDALIVFEPNTDSIDPEEGPNDQQPFSLLSRIKTSWKERRSLFAWADTGEWVTAERADQEARREGDSFRIGFEPIFVDYTKSGSWFMAFSLCQVRAFDRRAWDCRHQRDYLIGSSRFVNVRYVRQYHSTKMWT